MGEKEKGFNPTFENGGYWEYYKDLERQFEGFLEYVPYLEGNEKTYSFRLANILLSIGSHVDSAFKEMSGYPDFLERESCKEILRRANDKEGIIISGVRAFDEIYGLSSKEVTFKCLPERMQITPFKRVKPEWWDCYNDVKHDISNNLSKATLNAVRDALAGAFLLNVVHIPSALRLYNYGVLQTRMTYQGSVGIYGDIGTSISVIRNSIMKKEKITGDVETSIFKYDYYQ